MGYTTNFTGKAILLGDIPDGMIDFVNLLSHTRRMKRKVDEKYGIDGEFYVLGKGPFGQDNEPNIINFNDPPSTQPSLWCDWEIKEEAVPAFKSITDLTVVTKRSYFLQWNGSEKFYDCVDWMDYLISKVFDPYGVKLKGNIRWNGEDSYDVGEIYLFISGNEEQMMEADGHGHFPYLVGKSMPKLNFPDLLRKDKQIEFAF